MNQYEVTARVFGGSVTRNVTAHNVADAVRLILQDVDDKDLLLDNDIYELSIRRV